MVEALSKFSAKSDAVSLTNLRLNMAQGIERINPLFEKWAKRG